MGTLKKNRKPAIGNMSKVTTRLMMKKRMKWRMKWRTNLKGRTGTAADDDDDAQGSANCVGDW